MGDMFNLQTEIPTELRDAIEEIAKKEDRTRNEQIIRFLKEGVNRHNKTSGRVIRA